MIQYIYFVKCPGCEDEQFDFFDEAKTYALGCLSAKPIITQVEVDRDDFGCCTDSCDLGTIWSYEDALGNDCGSEDDNSLSTFTKSETFGISDEDFSKEFEDNDFIIALDSSNMRRLLSRFGKHDKIRMLLTRDVDDPWYTGDFSAAYRDITEGCLNLLSQVVQK